MAQPVDTQPDMAATLVDTRTEQQIDRRPLGVQSFGLTDRGKVRETNEDQFLIAALTTALRIQQSSLPQAKVRYADDQANLFIVADGMGGHAGGQQASALAVGTIEQFLLNALQWLFTLRGTGPTDILREFQRALRRADARVCEEAGHVAELRGMGTTLTMAATFGTELFLAHVGDSRCYLHRAGRLLQLTHDHTLVAQMVEAGAIDSDQASHHHLRHVITNVVGGPEPGVKTEVHKVELVPGDAIVLCTDGLTGMLTDDRIAEILAAEPNARAACERLVTLANEAGGTDNVTAIVGRFVADQAT